jgi:hypothetical protein
MPVHYADEKVVALFKNHPLPNPGESLKQGRPIYDDIEVVEIRFPGSRSVSVFPALSRSHWVDNPETGEQTPVTYAERFRRQYLQFKEHHQQTKSGTPLAHAPFVTEARRAELRALNIYTVEQLAHIDGQELKNLGQNGRELKNKAMEYMEEAKAGAPNAQMAAELEALKARNTILEEDAKHLATLKPERGDKADAMFDDMTVEQVREYITTNSGHAPHGTISRKTLVRMAMDLKQKV